MTPGEPAPDVFASEFCQNPYPAYQALREFNPVYLDPRRKLWVISRYADVRRVLQTSVEFSARSASFEHTLLGVDGDAHARVQRIVSRNLIENLGTLKQFVDVCVNAIVSRMADQRRGEIVGDLATYLPVSVAMELLGIDESSRDIVSRCAEAIADAGNELVSDNERAILRRQWDEFRVFLEGHFSRRRERDGLTLDCLFGDEGGLAPGERVDLGMLLMAAATQTTTGLIASAVRIMLSDLSIFQSLRRDASLISLFLEEVLRYEPPVQRRRRTVVRETEISGQPLPAGSELLVLIGAANRDAEKFTDADSFVVNRQPNDHLSFGFGAHRCLGRALSRIEAVAAITALVERLDALALSDPAEIVQHRQNLVIRSPLQLKVVC